MGRNGTANNGTAIINGINETISDENVLGYQVYWTLNSKDPVTKELNRVDIERFKRDMVDNGFDLKFFRFQTDKCRFIEVIEEVCKEYDDIESKKLFAREGKLAYKLVQSSVNIKGSSDRNLCNSSIEFQQDTTIIFDNNQGCPKIKGSGVKKIVKKIKDGFKNYKGKTSVEFIRFTFTDLLRQAGSVSMRGSGGIYFIPVVKNVTIEGIKNLTAKYGLGTIYQLRLPAGSAEKQGIKDSVQNELNQRLKYYVERVENVTRASTFEDGKKENGEEKKGIKTQVKEEVEDLFNLYSELLTESVNVEERQAEKANMFGEIREQYAKLENSITIKMEEIDN